MKKSYSAEDIREWVIYKITSPSGKIYIGKTVNYIQRMSFYRHLRCHKQKLIYNSLCKYGFENHVVEKIDVFNSTISYSVGKEMFWIRTYMSHESKYKMGKGLNLTNGGEGASGYIATEEYRKQKSEYAKNNPKFTTKGLAAWNKGKTGFKAWNKGVKFIGTEEERIKRYVLPSIGKKYNYKQNRTPEWTEKIAAQKRGVSNPKHYKGVVQLTKDGVFIKEFISIVSAAQELNLHSSGITNNAKGGQAYCGDFIFKYII